MNKFWRTEWVGAETKPPGPRIWGRLSPAGVPSPSPSSATPARPLPSCGIAKAVEDHYKTQRVSCRKEILEMKGAVQLELLDTGEVRRGRKELEVNRRLLNYGYDSLTEAAEDYPCVESVEAFRELVSALDAVNNGVGRS